MSEVNGKRKLDTKDDPFVEFHKEKKVKVIFNEERSTSITGSASSLSDLESKFESNSSSSSEDEQEDEHHTAVVINSFEEPFAIKKDHPKPKLSDYEILVENKYIGLNPIDWKGHKYRFGVYSFPWIQGRESSGIIKERGEKVSDDYKVNDEIFLVSTSYRDLRTSTFQQYTVFDSRLVWKLPENLTLKHSGGIGVGLVTAGSVLEELNVNLFEYPEHDQEAYLDPKHRKSLLIWGGSTGVGSYIIQLAKIAGFEKIIAVSSLKHEDNLKTLGATHVIDRFLKKEELLQKVEEIVPEGLQAGVDLVGKETSNLVIDFLNLNKKEGDAKVFVGVVTKPSLDEEQLKDIRVKQVLIKKFHENVDFGTHLVKKTTEFLEKGLIKPQKNLKIYNGFEGIVEGLKDLEKYGASNEKYIVEL